MTLFLYALLAIGIDGFICLSELLVLRIPACADAHILSLRQRLGCGSAIPGASILLLAFFDIRGWGGRGCI